jgi:hypothetical protein
MNKGIFRYVAFTAAFFLLGMCIKYFFCQPPYVLDGEYTSSDGAYTVKTASSTWGELGYVYCFDRITVQKNSRGLDYLNSKEIYNGSCFGKEPDDEPFVRWINNRALEITIYRERTDGNGYIFTPEIVSEELEVILNKK